MPLPKTAHEWEERAKQCGLFDDSSCLRNMSKMASASKVGLEDWLQLRVLWKVSNLHPTHETLFGKNLDGYRISKLEQDSNTHLDSLTWYKEALQSDSKNPLDWGALATWRESVISLARRIETLKTSHDSKKELREVPSGEDLLAPAKLRIGPVRQLRPRPIKPSQPNFAEGGGVDEDDEGKFPRDVKEKVQDRSPAGGQGGWSTDGSYDGGISFLVHSRPLGEEDVNYSFLALLGGLCLYDPKISHRVRWSPTRKEFTVRKPNSEGKDIEIITAMTDGCLQLLQDGQLDENCTTLSIIEVKARRRDKNNQDAIQMQEGAEMAAWISSQEHSGLLPSRVGESGTYRRVLLSQDFDQIYVTVASYDHDYIEYVTGRKTSSALRKITPDSPTPGGVPDLNADSDSESSSSGSQNSGSPDSPQGSWAASLPVRKTRQPALDRDEQTPSPQQPGSSPPMAPIKPTDNANKEMDNEHEKALADSMFLTMRQYKPFEVTKKDDMKKLMVLLLSLGRVLCQGQAPLGAR